MSTVTKLNLACVLEDSAKIFPNKTAVVFGEQKFSYAQMNGAASQIANGLKEHGIGKGDNVALSMLNLPYFPMIYYGILKTGATVVPLNVLLKKNEIAYHLKDSDAKAYFCFIGTPELPMGKEGWAGFNEAPDCKNFWLVTPPGVDNPIEGANTLNDLMANQSPVFHSVFTENNDSAVILYTGGTTSIKNHC